jgi:Zn-dependent protease
MPEAPDSPATACCPACGAEVAPALLSCPRCRRLVHAEALKRLAEEAEEAERAGELSTALVAWRSALELLPSQSRQHGVIAGRITALGRRVDEEAGGRPPSPPADESGPKSKWGGAGAAGLGTLALAFWKFKFLAVLALTKGKLLLLGLTKASTVFSMLLSLGVYWTAFGWKFALGLVASIYIHEMGHVAALRRYGIAASAPMFLPGFGAVIRMKQAPGDPRQDARVGLAGPLWGFGAALVAYAVALATAAPIWAAIAQVGAWINLFNLMPLGPLDGGRAFRTLTRPQRWLAVATIALMWSITEEGLLVLLVLVAALHTATVPPAKEPDRGALLQYAALVAALSLMLLIPVNGLR